MKFFYLITGLLLLQACKHPLAIEGEGDIVDRLAGSRGCTLEEFRAKDARCTDNAAVGEAYTASYEAIPREGWVFTGWRGTKCSKTTPEGYCDFNMPLGFVEFIADNLPLFNAPPTIAVFVQPGELFRQEIAGPVLEARCLACHIDGGLSGFTRLVFDNVTSANQDINNIKVFQNFLETVEDAEQTILTKVRGGAGHGGGTIFSSASDEYDSLVRFLNLLQGEGNTSTVATTGFWDGIRMADAQATLRRAAIIVAGRLPTKAEISQAKSGAPGLRTAIRGLMNGAGFHDFLIRGANDRLLTDSLWQQGPFDVIAGGADLYPVMARIENDFFNRSSDQDPEYRKWRRDFTFGFGRAPLELIAYVVEREKPYTEILTANHTMVNRGSAKIVRQDAISFASQNNLVSGTIFKPAKNKGHVVRDNVYVQERFGNGSILVKAHSGFIDYPHAGILSEPAFLSRYPTTETNRNRARARWTYYHFLGVDIEKSAGRTTDPEALADTDNPTLNNPNCAVCHQIMDPVAGAFRDFGNEGWFHDQGYDSLPDSYKNPKEPPFLYESGDLWFRDMREPGFESRRIPVSGPSIVWLSKQITEDSRFASAAVKFWWPALMGTEPAVAPEVSSDQNFRARLRAFEAQQTDIETLASNFRAGINGGAPYNLKDLLVEMILSNWFRASQSRSSLGDERYEELQEIGTRRLLTPQELEAKTFALLGFRWDEQPDELTPRGFRTALADSFNIYYGDIDSRGIVVRGRQLTPLMVNVAEAHAVYNACALVVIDINRTESERKLFKGISRSMTPASHKELLLEKIVDWHDYLLGEKLSPLSPEVQASFDLLGSFWQSRVSNGPGNPHCNLPDEWYQQPDDIRSQQAQDPEQMLGAWVSLLIYFMTDFNYLHE